MALEDLNDLSEEDLASVALARRQKQKEKEMLMQQSDPTLGQTLSDFALGFSEGMLGRSPAEVVQKAQANRRDQQLNRLKAMQSEEALGIKELQAKANLQKRGAQSILDLKKSGYKEEIDPETGTKRLVIDKDSLAYQEMLRKQEADANKLETIKNKADIQALQNELKANQKNISSETSLREEFNKLPETKDMRGINSAYKKIEEIAKNPSAASDIGLIYNLVKVWDPNSAVKEGEIDLARANRSVPNQIMGAWNKVSSGQILTPAEREDFINQARKAYTGQLSSYNQVAEQYKTLATQYGVAPERVVQNFPQVSAPIKGIQPSGGQYTPDVLQYAQAHGITPDQALSIKKQRTGQ